MKSSSLHRLTWLDRSSESTCVVARSGEYVASSWTSQQLLPVHVPALRKSRSWVGLAALACLLAGCTGEVVVPVQGQLKLEGRAAGEGQLLLIPRGQGVTAAANVDELGKFQLSSTGHKNGVIPGEYDLLFRQSLTEKQRRTIARQADGHVNVDELNVTYRCLEAPLVVKEPGEQNLEINISLTQGWSRTTND